MYFIKNEDIKVLKGVQKMLKDNSKILTLGNELNKKLIEEYSGILSLIYKGRIEGNNRCNNYNKTNKEYHNIYNNLHNARKSGNEEKIKYWGEKLEEYKKNKNNVKNNENNLTN